MMYLTGEPRPVRYLVNTLVVSHSDHILGGSSITRPAFYRRNGWVVCNDHQNQQALDALQQWRSR
jgi:hypothetical protein